MKMAPMITAGLTMQCKNSAISWSLPSSHRKHRRSYSFPCSWAYPRIVSPAVIMGAIFNVSLLLKICEILPKNLQIFEKNSRIVENFFGKKLLTRQKIRSIVTLGKMLP